MQLLSIFPGYQNTSRPDSRRWFGKKSLGVLTAFVLCLGGTSGAGAQDAKTFPGALCQASGSSQGLCAPLSEITSPSRGNGWLSVSEIGTTPRTLPVWRTVKTWTEQQYGRRA
jgi:hypothetical protein